MTESAPMPTLKTWRDSLTGKLLLLLVTLMSELQPPSEKSTSLNTQPSHIAKSAKIKFFRDCVERNLLHGAKMWTISKELEKRLDGTYTWLLMRAQNLSWKPSKKGRNLRRTSAYLQKRGSKKSKIRRPPLSFQRPGDLRSTVVETTLFKAGKQTSHLYWHLGQGHRP